MMGFRKLILVKKMVLRSCVRQAVQPANFVLADKHARPLAICTFNNSFLHTRSLSVLPSNRLCKRSSQRQSGQSLSYITNPQRTWHPSALSWQTMCQHVRCLHLSDQHPSEAKKDVEDKAAEETSTTPDEDDDPLVAKYDESGKPLSNWKRMKMMMKAYGYVIIPVHWVIAPFWFGAFYYVIKMGVDIGPILLKMGVSEHHVQSLQNSGASNALMAYALYKIFTPLRYTVTLGATEMTIRYLRRHGYMKTPPPKEKTYRESLQETVMEMRDKAQDVKDKAQEKAQDFKDKAQERVQDFKDKRQDLRDKRKN